MTRTENDLPTTHIIGTWRGSNGGYWSTDGIIIDGTYVLPPPEPEVVTEGNKAYNIEMIKRQTGLDDFTFNLRLLDKALNKNDAYGAIKDIWRIVESDRGWVDPHWRINDDLFKNKIVSFSLADALQKSGFSAREAIIAVANSRHVDSTSYALETPKLSGGTFSPVKALGHYLWGKGEKLEVDINTIGLNVLEHKLPLLRQAIENTKSPGVYHLIDPRVAYNTFDDSIATGAYLGRITLNMSGDFTRSDDGSWRFVGVIKAYHDRYDFNASNRPRALEELTTAGRALPGTSYDIDISGEHKVHLVGNGYQFLPL
ncbi:hypothetical protein BK660_23730 [Pseudomonas brassicacearum]|uniref:Colicin M-like protein n=1 Tax=Pseudomonas brassicacearum TaxID=930166 RepID=A0A423HWR7_9PSED|nr:lipid II-degrading bacteriocin [Pseudomonas brassicacearum]RON17664.1 hypothetical protein BK660_23730 [Pseudomonas brassicacearum]